MNELLAGLGGFVLATGGAIYFALKAYSARTDAGAAQKDAAEQRGLVALRDEQLAESEKQKAQLGADLAAANAKNSNLEALYAKATMGAPPGADSRDGFLRAAEDMPGAVASAGSPASAVPGTAAANPIGDGLIDPSKE